MQMIIAATVIAACFVFSAAACGYLGFELGKLYMRATNMGRIVLNREPTNDEVVAIMHVLDRLVNESTESNESGE